jgi:ABC-2 type transport system ATP-binding protein
LGYISYGNLLTHGTVEEVVEHVGLATWSVSGPNLLELARQLRDLPGVQQAVAFGTTLHVSGDDHAALEQAIAPFRREPYRWVQVRSGLEDVFIHLMEHSKDNFAP